MNDKRTRPLQLDEPIVTGNTKAAVKSAGGGSSDLWTIPPEQIHYDPRDNVRPLNKDRVRHIADLIKANGYDRKKPLGCFVRKVGGEDQIFVYEGQHRYHGALLAIEEGTKLDRLPCIIDAAETVNRANLIYAGINNNDGEKLTPLELAEKVVELRDLGEKDGDIARRLNVTDQTLRDVTLLASAPVGLHKLVRDKAVASTLAIEEIRAHGPVKALERLTAAVVEAKAGGKTKATKKHLTRVGSAGSTATKITEPQAKSLFQALQAVLHDNGFGKLSPGARNAVQTTLEPLVDLLDVKPRTKTWPVTPPDAAGNCKAIDKLAFVSGDSKKSVAEIHTAQPAAGVWIHSITYNFGYSYAGGPLKVYRNTRPSWTRVQAIRAAAADLIAALTGGKRFTKAEQALGEKVIAWARTLINQPDPDWTNEMGLAAAQNRAPDLSALFTEGQVKSEKKAGSKGLDPATAWPFPSGALAGGAK